MLTNWFHLDMTLRLRLLVEERAVDQAQRSLSTKNTVTLQSSITQYFYMPTNALTVCGIQRDETQAL